MTDATQLLAAIDSLWRKGYGRNLPAESDKQFLSLASLYIDGDATQRREIREAVTDRSRLLLIGFSHRIATLADRQGDRDLLFRALVAHAIENFEHDERENILRLSVVNHVAEKLGLSPVDLFEDAAKISSPRAASALRAFISRPPELKSLRVMNIVEENSEEGVIYRGQQPAH